MGTNMSDDRELLAEIKAQAAEAAAQAAEARAAAAQAKVEALEARISQKRPETHPNPDTATDVSNSDTTQSDRYTSQVDVPNTSTTLNKPDVLQKEPRKNRETEKPSSSQISTSVPYEETVRQGYQFSGRVLTIGTFSEDGVPRVNTKVNLPLAMINRHGLIAGATGSGKTRTLQLLAESLSDAGVSVFVTDIKGDLSGMAQTPENSIEIQARATDLGQDWIPKARPVEFLKLGESGIGATVRTTITDMGPLLLSRILDINETQESALNLVFHWCDKQGIAIVDITDIRAVFVYITSPDGKAEINGIGGVSNSTAGVILRAISSLEAQGGGEFFGEPAFETRDLLMRNPDGTGQITCIEIPNVVDNPKLISTFVMWILADLFSEIPEVGDQEQPKLVFFFDEAHILFDGANPAFVDAVVRTVRIVRSKGVGIFFVTQTAKDLPADVLAQLGTKIQHVIRAFTPQDAKVLKDTVSTFPHSPYDLEKTLISLGTGEAVVTVLNTDGKPTPVAVTKIWAPSGYMGSASDTVIQNSISNSALGNRYNQRIDPISAAEKLTERIEYTEKLRDQAQQQKNGTSTKSGKSKTTTDSSESPLSKQMNSMMKTALTTATRAVTTQILRNIFGTRRR